MQLSIISLLTRTSHWSTGAKSNRQDHQDQRILSPLCLPVSSPVVSKPQSEHILLEQNVLDVMELINSSDPTVNNGNFIFEEGIDVKTT